MTTVGRIGAVLVLGLVASTASGRQWTDSTGRWSVEADLIAFNDQTVVLKKENHDLVSVPIEKLSSQDRQYLKSKEGADLVRRSLDQLQTWEMKSGLKVVGKVVGYGRKELVVQRRMSKLYVNDRPYNDLPEVYRRMVPKIVAHFEKVELNDAKDLDLWSQKQRGEARRYPCDGVTLKLENGDEYVVPFFFFSAKDAKILQAGWETWVAAEKNPPKQEEQSFLLESAASAYQRDRMVSQQIAAMQLDMLAYNSGLFDLWEVRLFPKPGVAGGPVVAVVPARDSRSATQEAMKRYPGYVAGPVSQIRRKRF